MCAVPRSVAEKDIKAVIGERVTLPCHTHLPTPVDWRYRSSVNETGKLICSDGNIVNGYSKRFSLDRSIQGDYTLIIRNFTRGDAGVYICRYVGEGIEHRFTLSAIGKLNISKHNIITLCLWSTRNRSDFRQT